MSNTNDWLRSNTTLGAALGVLTVFTIVFLITLEGVPRIALAGVGVAGVLLLVAKISQNRRKVQGSR